MDYSLRTIESAGTEATKPLTERKIEEVLQSGRGFSSTATEDQLLRRDAVNLQWVKSKDEPSPSDHAILLPKERKVSP